MRRTGSALVVSVLVALAAAGLGCMPSQDQGGPAAGTGGAGGASGTGGRGGAGPGSGGGGAGSGGAQGSGGAAGPDAGGETSAPASGSCTELRSRPAGADGTLALAVEATVAGKPLVFGEANSFAGGTLTPTNFRFYIAEPYLIQAGGARLPVDLVGADGRPLPYNVHLVSLESPETQVVRLAAPPGSYDGVGFLFGVGDACNAIDPARQKAPLNIASQMTWPHATGYLFLRYEAQVTGVSGAPAAIHMGGKIGQIFAPDVALTVMGKLAVTTTPRPVALRVALDQIFAGAALEATLPSDFGPPSPEAIAGEHLRQNLSRVKVFSLAGP